MHQLIRLLFLSCLFVPAYPVVAQSHWICFKDKGESVLHGTPALSDRALARRQLQGIPLDTYDYPVSRTYLRQLGQAGIPAGYASRWLNAVAAELTSQQVQVVSSLPFVRQVLPIRASQQVARKADACPDSAELHSYLRQLEMVDLDVMHQHQLTGRGIMIAVFDNGFEGVNTLPGFDHLFAENRILGTKDFVDGDDDVYHGCSHCKHGTYVFSILAAVMPGQLIGSAPGADYLLLRTENDDSETRQEEVNWVAAAEYADSMGAHVFSTSLGYFDFDGFEEDYAHADLNGNTTTITRAADRAASRGIVVVNSAGNEGFSGITAPADGDSVLAIGAVDGCGAYASFSSQGPSADGRVKPDLSALGRGSFYLTPTGRITRGVGTSFSCPIVSGLAACLLQAYPGLPSMALHEALKQSATQYQQPDHLLGYGIPSGIAAWEWLHQQYEDMSLISDIGTRISRYDPFANSLLSVYPNPANGQVYLTLLTELNVSTFQANWFDLMGRALGGQQIDMADLATPYRLSAPTQPGVYLLRLQNARNGDLMFVQKVIIQGGGF